MAVTSWTHLIRFWPPTPPEERCERGVQDLGGLVEAYSEWALASQGISRLVDGVGWPLVSSRRFSEARSVYQASLEMPLPRDEQGLVQVRIVYADIAGGDYEGAIELCQGIIARYPGTSDAADALLAIGWCGMLQEKWAEALEASQRVMDELPDTNWANTARLWIEQTIKPSMEGVRRGLAGPPPGAD